MNDMADGRGTQYEATAAVCQSFRHVAKITLTLK
jgi:hypothetical protein